MTAMTQEIYQSFLNKGTILSSGNKRLILGCGKRNWSQKPLNGPGPHFYFPDFFLKIGLPWFTHEYWVDISIDEFKTFLEEKIQPEIKWEILKASFFENTFCNLEESFKNAELVKAVPYIFESTTSKMSHSQLQLSLKSLADYLEDYPAFLYGLWEEEEGFLGATPEILFQQQNGSNILETVACAGTYNEAQEDLKYCPKMLLEHDIVVQGIESSLKPFGNVSCQPIKPMQFASLIHLVTPMSVELNQTFNFEQLVRVLHPTPALGAYPKNKGGLWLEKYQMNMPRGRFGAPVGFLYNNQASCYVAIRNVQWNKKGMMIGAGCGVISGSQFKQEWQEVLSKLNAIKEMLKL
jgi:menaquinone-specific isochorismate synthase